MPYFLFFTRLFSNKLNPTFNNFRFRYPHFFSAFLHFFHFLWGQSNFKPFSLFAISRATQTRTHTNTSLFVRTNIVLYVRTKVNA